MKFNGYDLAEVSFVPSASHCQFECQKNEACLFFTFDSGGGNCYLKTNNVSEASTFRVSGSRFCISNQGKLQLTGNLICIVGCRDVVQLGFVVLSYPWQVPLRLRLISLFYSLKIPLKLKIRNTQLILLSYFEAIELPVQLVSQLSFISV